MDNSEHEALRRYGMARMQYQFEQVEPLLRMGRAFADPMRVRILALLSRRSMYGQELAEALEVKPPTISHHMVILTAAGLVQVRKENSYHHYSLNLDGLQQASQLLTLDYLHSLAETVMVGSSIVDTPPEDKNRQMTLDAYFKDGQLLSIPQSAQARRYVIDKIAESFEWGRIYDEKEVNAILKTMHPDAATLRRELIDQKIMLREHGRYWLARPRNP